MEMKTLHFHRSHNACVERSISGTVIKAYMTMEEAAVTTQM